VALGQPQESAHATDREGRSRWHQLTRRWSWIWRRHDYDVATQHDDDHDATNHGHRVLRTGRSVKA
jgi:hypothetical protein